MKFIINANAAKSFSRIIKFASRISDEIFFEATKNELQIKVVNTSMTAYADIIFPKSFFTSYHCDESNFDDNNYRICVKTLLSLFKGIKSFESCKMESDIDHSRILVDFVNRKLIKTSHFVYILEHVNLENFTESDSYPNTVVSSPQLFLKLLDHFPENTREICMESRKEKFYIKNHIDYPEKDVETIRVKWSLNDSEFSTYKIDEESSIIFTCQDFKSIVQFADSLEASVKIDFSSEGEPIVITCQNEVNFRTVIVLATIKESDLRATRKPRNITNYRALLGSFIESNKRQSLNRSTDQSPKKIKKHKKNSNSNENNRRIDETPAATPSYTDSELRIIMKSPDISVFATNNDKSQAAQRRNGSVEASIRIHQENSKRQKSLNANEESHQNFLENFQECFNDEIVEINRTNEGASTSRAAVVQHSENPYDDPENYIDSALEKLRKMNVPNTKINEPIKNKKSHVNLFQSESEIATYDRTEMLQIKTANRKAKQIFYNVIKTSPFTADGGEIIVPPSDDEEDL